MVVFQVSGLILRNSQELIFLTRQRFCPHMAGQFPSKKLPTSKFQKTRYHFSPRLLFHLQVSHTQRSEMEICPCGILFLACLHFQNKVEKKIENRQLWPLNHGSAKHFWQPNPAKKREKDESKI